jgi:hypothetical protein
MVLMLEDPDFSWFFVINEHVLRFLALREPKDYYTGPVYYYLPRILLFAFPWAAFIPLLAWPRRGGGGAPVSDVEKLAWLWFGVSLAFFSVSQAKANYYMTLAMPAFAILIGLHLSEAIRQGRRYRLMALSGLLAACALLALWAVDQKFWMTPPRGIWRAVFRSQSDLHLALELTIVLAAVAAILFWLRHGRLALYAVAASGVPLLVFFVVMMQRVDRWVSARSVAEYVKVNLPSSKVYLFQDYENLSSLPFYLGKTVPIVDSASHDLAFGRRLAQNGQFLSSTALSDRLAQERVLLLVHRQRLPAFEDALGKSGLTPLRRIGAVTLFTN